jgi:coenzyme PQQ precursor peptide PqqA
MISRAVASWRAAMEFANVCKCLQIDRGRPPAGLQSRGRKMWHKPVIKQICLGAEINSYVSAARK